MCCLLGSCKIQVPTKKLVGSTVLEESIGYIETANQQMSKQENETENNRTEHSSINFTTTDEATQIGILTQSKDSKPATSNPAPNSYF